MNYGHPIKALDEWLETMKQDGGYGGPVSHWWQSCYQFVGPGLDWRYEGLLTGYTILWTKTRELRWYERLKGATRHLIQGQFSNGSYANSRFEANPGTLGTPHEAAASLGLLRAASILPHPEIVRVAITNIEHLIDVLWDKDRHGVNDWPGIPGRVPNKLATLAEALMLGAQIGRQTGWLELADSALTDILRLQIRAGTFKGAVHQWGHGTSMRGDGRFFPYYNARCIPALVEGWRLLNNPAYLHAAEGIGDFLDRFRHADGSWPQLLYENGHRIEYPHWIAPVSDILRSYIALERPIPPVSLERLLRAQLPTGGFPTAEGFRRRYRPALKSDTSDYLDVTPVVGWNDKVLRLLAELAPHDIQMPDGGPITSDCTLPITIGPHRGWYHEDRSEMSITSEDGRPVFNWQKSEPWSMAEGEVMIR